MRNLTKLSERIIQYFICLQIVILINFKLRILPFEEFISYIKSKKYSLKKYKLDFLDYKISKLSTFLPNQTCLIKSSCYFILSDKEEINLVIGVKRDESEFNSHAWIVEDNKVIFEQISDIDQYNEIFRL